MATDHPEKTNHRPVYKWQGEFPPTTVDVPVNDWETLEKELFRDSLWDDLRRLRTKCLFRGLSSAAYELTTTLQRMKWQHGKKISDPPEWEAKDVEPKIIRNFVKYAHKEMHGHDSDWKRLPIAQHHCLPTRLLDWTNSPFVALHFTVCEPRHFEHAGAVWAVNFVKLSTCKQVPKKLLKILKNKKVKVFTGDELVSAGIESLEDLDRFSKTRVFMLFFEPPSIDERIANQYALHSVMSSAKEEPQQWLLKLGRRVCRRIVFPKKLKPEIRDRLDMMNVTERTLFPGLDGLTDWLKRYYGPTFWDKNEWNSLRQRMRGPDAPAGEGIGGSRRSSAAGAI